MALPIFQSDSQPLQLMQTRWASELNPFLKLPISSPSLLSNISIVSGVNVINHRLGRKPQGWIVSDINAAVTLFRSADFNDLTLTLTSSGAATVALMVY